MKKRYGVRAALAMAAVMATVTACGSAKGSMYESSTENMAAYDSGGGFAASYDTAASETEAGYVYDETVPAQEEIADEGQELQDVPEGALAGRKMIKNVDMNVETEQFDTLLLEVGERVTALGGYIENMSSYSRTGSYPSDYIGTKYLRYADITARIPKENLDAFLTEVGEQTNVVSRSESVTDVTLQYVDLESHKKALTTEQDRLLELLGKAENVEDIIAIEGRLSEVRYQLESMESQLRTYDNQIDYSTVYLYINEVERYTPGEKASTGERIRMGFVNSLHGVGRNLADCVIWVLVNIPYLVVWAVIIVIVLFVLRLVWKVAAKKRGKGTGKCFGKGFLRAHGEKSEKAVSKEREGRLDAAADSAFGGETETGRTDETGVEDKR